MLFINGLSKLQQSANNLAWLFQLPCFSGTKAFPVIWVTFIIALQTNEIGPIFGVA